MIITVYNDYIDLFELLTKNNIKHIINIYNTNNKYYNLSYIFKYRRYFSFSDHYNDYVIYYKNNYFRSQLIFLNITFIIYNYDKIRKEICYKYNYTLKYIYNICIMNKYINCIDNKTYHYNFKHTNSFFKIKSINLSRLYHMNVFIYN